MSKTYRDLYFEELKKKTNEELANRSICDDAAMVGMGNGNCLICHLHSENASCRSIFEELLDKEYIEPDIVKLYDLRARYVLRLDEEKPVTEYYIVLNLDKDMYNGQIMEKDRCAYGELVDTISEDELISRHSNLISA